MPEKSDETIAQEVQRGDIEAFGALVERYEQKLARYARKFLFTSEDGKDLVQEVFLKAYINIKSFDPNKKFSSWIYRIAHNEYINAIKKKSRTPLFFFDLDLVLPQPVSSETADGNLNDAETRKMLDETFEKLPAKYREPLVLYYYEEMDYKEIAEILHIPIATVGVRLRRGKALLKTFIPDH